MPHSHQTSDVAIVDHRRSDRRLGLADGRRLQIRPIDRDDVDRLAGLFARLSPESRYRRFLSPKPRLEPRELAHLTNLDYVDHDALAAVDGDRDSIVGVARYARDRSRPSAAVADDLQGLGIGTMLARLTVQRARENGYELLIATTLWDNRPARALLRRLGFEPAVATRASSNWSYRWALGHSSSGSKLSALRIGRPWMSNQPPTWAIGKTSIPLPSAAPSRGKATCRRRGSGDPRVDGPRRRRWTARSPARRGEAATQGDCETLD